VRVALGAGALAAAAALAACGATTPAKPKVWPGSAATHPGKGPSHLAVAEDTDVLPLNLLVAEADNRLVSLSPRGQVVWHAHQSDPTQVFVSRTGRTLVIAERRRALVVMRRVDNLDVSYRYGKLRSPQTALETRSGDVVIADPGSCTIVFVSPASQRPLETLGTPGVCVHRAPASFAAPDAAFPAGGGELVVTERDPGWIDVLSRDGKPIEEIRLRGLRDPSDANAYGDGRLIVTARTDPGEVEELGARGGAVTWSYGPTTGSGRLDDPSLARVLPDGDVLIVDSGNDRIIVVDPRGDRIVWQYGHTGQAGKAAGYLDDPGSATLVPIGP
jgi:DNA-binding beta-propeller fold protein YncE